MRVNFKLEKTIEKLGITKNRLSVESKVRSNTISDLSRGKAKAINIETLEAILGALNRIAAEKGIEDIINVHDVIHYE